MATKIWDAAAATPTGTHRIPADVSAAGSPTRYTVQQLADLYISTGVTAQALGNVTGATAISLAAGGIVTATATGNTTFSITNPPTAGSEWVLILTNGGAHTITWFTTTWAGGTAPTLTASGVDVIHFATPDGGTTWYGWHEIDESGYVASTLFDANTILAANSDNTPAAVTIAENDLVGRLAGGNIGGITLADLTADATPAAGDFLLGWETGGALRKFDVGDLPGGTATPGGSDTHVQYNDGGAFGGEAAFSYDKTTNTLTVSTHKSVAGEALALTATAPAATTGASVAGVAATITAGSAVASTDTAGAAAGGSVTITAGAAARLTSGNANGGDINLVPGAGIGTGTVGKVVLPTGVNAANLGVVFSGDTNTGFYAPSGDTLKIATGGSERIEVSNYGTIVSIALTGNGATASISGFKATVTARTTDAAEAGATSYAVVTNAGATALVTRTLPAAVAGWTYTFIVMDADGLKIQAASGDDIRVLDKITGTAGYIQSTTIGSVVTLVAVDATTWVATSIHGVWTDGTFTYDDTANTTP